MAGSCVTLIALADKKLKVKGIRTPTRPIRGVKVQPTRPIQGREEARFASVTEVRTTSVYAYSINQTRNAT